MEVIWTCDGPALAVAEADAVLPCSVKEQDSFKCEAALAIQPASALSHWGCPPHGLPPVERLLSKAHGNMPFCSACKQFGNPSMHIECSCLCGTWAAVDTECTVPAHRAVHQDRH